MEWTTDQRKALDIMYQNYKTQNFTFISGVAGSGKTSLLLEIVSRLGLKEDEVRCLSYTGKASQVLYDKGLPNVSTIHSFLYYPVTDRYDNISGWAIKPRTYFEEIKLLIIDEISMVPNAIWMDLLSLRLHIICVGDLEQLPPVESTNKINWHWMYKGRPHISIKNLACDYHMTEITRQAAESDIINQSLLIRNFGASKFLNQLKYKSKEVEIISTKDVTEDLMLSQDIILCATNNKRKALNYVVRTSRYPNFSSEDLKYPMNNDIVICLENRWDTLNLGGHPIINGLRGRLDGFQLKRKFVNSNQVYKMSCNLFSNEDHHTKSPNYNNLFKNLNLNYNDLILQSSPLSKNEYLILDKPISVDYGYAISVHKSQGSEFSNVMIFEESWPSEPSLRNQFWYTAITRAKLHVTIVKPY